MFNNNYCHYVLKRIHVLKISFSHDAINFQHLKENVNVTLIKKTLFQYIESYVKEVKNVLGELEKFHRKLTEFASGERLSTSSDPFVFSKHTFDTNKLISQQVLQTGEGKYFFFKTVIMLNRIIKYFYLFDFRQRTSKPN